MFLQISNQRNTRSSSLSKTRILPTGDGSLATHRQIFAPPQQANEIPLIIIPNLATLSLAAARACIMLVDANVVHLERHGQKVAWSPRYYWLAACHQEEVGSVSSHLLDRFALRLSWHSAGQLSIVLRCCPALIPYTDP